MRVGMTFDLRDHYLALGYGEEETAEFDSMETIDAIHAFLEGRGHEVVRIGTVRQLAERLVAGERWDLVFNIAEGLAGLGREAQVPALLEAYGVPYTFSDPLTLALTLDKAMAKRVVRDMGIPTPDFAVVEREADLARLDLPFPLFAKPLAEGTGKGISAASRVESREALAAVCRRLLREHRQPVLVETFLPGRELTVGIVGTGDRARSIGVMEVLFGERAESWGYTYENKEHYEDRVTYRLADDAEARAAEETALRVYRGLRCLDGGRVDLRSDASGVPCFLEVNPLAGINPVRSDLVILGRLAGIAYDDLLGEILDSAVERHGLRPALARAPG